MRSLSDSTKPHDKTHYDILGASREDSPDEIREKFLARAKELHPDRNTENEEVVQKFHAVNKAYDVLRDSALRKKYDQSLDGGGRRNTRSRRLSVKRRETTSSSVSPDLWEEHEDAATGRVYYYNTQTQESTWIKPAAMGGGRAPASRSDAASGGEWEEYFDSGSQRSYWHNRSTGESTWTNPAMSRETEDLGGGWVRYYDRASGRPYYHNAQSGETTWNPPAQAAAGQPTALMAVQKTATTPAPGGSAQENSPWEKHYDEESKRNYWWNRETDESRWTDPNALSRFTQGLVQSQPGQQQGGMMDRVKNYWSDSPPPPDFGGRWKGGGR